METYLPMQLMKEAGIVDLIILSEISNLRHIDAVLIRQCEKSSNKTNFLSREVKMEVSQ